MAESFSAALKRYIASGYKAPEAMRAVWHDVRLGRVERPARRTRRARGGGDPVAARVLGESRRHPQSSGYGELSGEQHQVLNAWARFGPTHWLRKVKGGWIDELPPIVGSFPTVWKTKREAEARVDRLIQIRSREWRGLEANPRRRKPRGNPVTLSARAAGKIASADPAVRRLPRVGWCVRLSDGRELCHDARGYYLVGTAHAVQARRTAMKLTARGMNPLTRAETGATLKAIRDSVKAARRPPSMTAPERQDPVARAAHRGWWYGQADAFAQVVRELGTRRRRPVAYAMRGRRIYYGPGAALRRNPPTIRAEDIRAGDVILPPARELSLWMRRHLREKGLPESALELTVVSVREGAPDKSGRWLIVATRQNEAWYAGQPRPAYPFTFKVRPASPWPILRRSGGAPNPADPSRFLPAGHPVYQTRQRVPKWTVPVSPAHVPKLLRRRLGHFTKGQHEQHALEHQHRSEVAEDRWQQLVSAATRQYGRHGPLISGVVREHFPEALKRELRRLASAISEERDVAWAHWKAAGHRTGLATRNPRRPRGRARREAMIGRTRFGLPEYSEATGHVHSLIHDDYLRALQRAEYYRWAAGKGFPSRDPLTGREERGGAFQRGERDCNKAQARVWLDQAAKLRGSMRRRVLPNPPRWRVGDRAAIADPLRAAARFWSAQHRGIVGAGGTILPREILDRSGVIASVGAGRGGSARRVLLDWGMDAENRSLGIWLDGDELVRGPRGNPRRRPRGALTVPEQHQLRIARASLRMPGPMLGVMGGPDPRQAARIVRQLGRGRRNQPFTAGAPEIQAFLAAWHEAGRADFERSYRNLDYDSPAYQHVARDRRKYIALDQGTGGVFLVDKATGDVFTIKGYGVPNRRVGTLAQVTARYQAGQAPPRGFERYQGNPRRRRQAGAWGSMGLLPRRRSRRPFRNPAAGFETFDLGDRAGWERAIRTAGGLRVSRAERGELAEVPGYLKGYRRGVAPDELAQMIADERGLPARDVERAMLAAFHGPRRRAATLESVDYERLEREAIQHEGAGARGGESRPRVRVGLDVFTLRPRSPFKGSIHHVNPPRPRGTLIYDRLLELRARKGRRSHYPRELFKHGFKPGARVIGLPSGDVLLHGARGQRLWQQVEV